MNDNDLLMTEQKKVGKEFQTHETLNWTKN